MYPSVYIVVLTLAVHSVKCSTLKEKSQENEPSLLSLFINSDEKTSDKGSALSDFFNSSNDSVRSFDSNRTVAVLNDSMRNLINDGSNATSGFVNLFNPNSSSISPLTLPGNHSVRNLSSVAGTNITDQNWAPTTTGRPTFVQRVKTGATRIGGKVGSFIQNLPKAASEICLQKCPCGCEHNHCKDCGTHLPNLTTTSQNNFTL